MPDDYSDELHEAEQRFFQALRTSNVWGVSFPPKIEELDLSKGWIESEHDPKDCESCQKAIKAAKNA